MCVLESGKWRNHGDWPNSEKPERNIISQWINFYGNLSGPFWPWLYSCSTTAGKFIGGGYRLKKNKMYTSAWRVMIVALKIFRGCNRGPEKL